MFNITGPDDVQLHGVNFIDKIFFFYVADTKKAEVSVPARYLQPNLMFVGWS